MSHLRCQEGPQKRDGLTEPCKVRRNEVGRRGRGKWFGELLEEAACEDRKTLVCCGWYIWCVGS